MYINLPTRVLSRYFQSASDSVRFYINFCVKIQTRVSAAETSATSYSLPPSLSLTLSLFLGDKEDLFRAESENTGEMRGRARSPEDRR